MSDFKLSREVPSMRKFVVPGTLAVFLQICSWQSAGLARAQDEVPQAPDEVLEAIPFSLKSPYEDRSQRAHERRVQSGYLVVLRSASVLGTPTPHNDRLLHCNDELAEPLNHGHQSGVIVAILPKSCLRGEAAPWDAFVWFGSRSLAETVREEKLKDERRSSSRALGVNGRLGAVSDRGGKPRPAAAPQQFESKRELLGLAAQMIRTYAPEDEGFAESYTVPATVQYPGP